MALDTFYNHKCDIYHIKKDKISMGYGLNKDEFSYSDTADIKDVQCHFNVKSDNSSFYQTEPKNTYTARIKLVLPLSVDVRLNDKVVNKSNGYEYIAEEPVNVQNHHQFVYVKRNEAV